VEVINSLLRIGFGVAFAGLALLWLAVVLLVSLPHLSIRSYARRTRLNPKNLPVVLTPENRRKTPDWKPPEPEAG
jgi:hypothetical protein